MVSDRRDRDRRYKAAHRDIVNEQKRRARARKREARVAEELASRVPKW